MERTSGRTQAGEAIRSDIRATTILRKEIGHWRAVHHHTDRFSSTLAGGRPQAHSHVAAMVRPWFGCGQALA